MDSSGIGILLNRYKEDEGQRREDLSLRSRSPGTAGIKIAGSRHDEDMIQKRRLLGARVGMP